MKTINLYQYKYLWFGPAAMLILALLPFPYGYYSLLRVIVTLAAGLLAYWLFQDSVKDKWAVAFGCAALLFNPIIPIHLSRDTWAPIDVAVAGLFLLHYYFNKENATRPKFRGE